MVEPGMLRPVERWWPTLPWRTAEEDPIRSTGTSIAECLGLIEQ
jgi:hypothetical protein